MKLKNVVGLALLFAMMFSLSACTDYEGVVDDKYEEWKETSNIIFEPEESNSSSSDAGPSSSIDSSSSSSSVIPDSSSSVIPGSDPESSSSFASSSSITYGTLTDARDGHTYKTVTIGTQTWMAENLNYETGNSWCYDDNASNCGKFGRLYTWSAVMDSAAQFSVNAGTTCGYGKTCTPNSPHRGICPEGWHVPTNWEYSALYIYIGGSSTAGSLLKSTSGWLDSGNGSDKYGFSVLPAGSRYGSGAYLWSASEVDGSFAWYQDFYYDTGVARQLYRSKDVGQSLRCLKDSSSTSGAATSSSSQAQPSSSSSSITYGTLTDSRDNQVYKTVTIGTQTWMAENLNYAYTGVKYNYSGYTTYDSTSWCYDNLASNCSKYGRLYTWSAVMDSAAQFSVNAGTKCGYDKTCTPNSPHRGICPEGWHVPTNGEYRALYTYIGGSSIAGSLLKSTSGWYRSGNGFDKYGFSVLPAGEKGVSVDGEFFSEDSYAHLWSASESSNNHAWVQDFNYDDDGAYQNHGNKNFGLSLRCLRDLPSTSGVSTSSSSQAQPSSSSSTVIPDPDRGSSSSIASSSSIKDGSEYDASANTLTDLRDNQVYKTVTIGSQTWMAENLNYAYTGVKYNYGSYSSDSTSWCYDNKASNCDKYGRLYTWSAVMDSAAQFSVNAGTKCGYGKTCTPNSPHRGICPVGWHVPTDEEYNALYTYIGGSSTAGSLLKSTSGWINGGNGSDKYGFSVLPAGGRYYDGYFYPEGDVAYLWSASEDDSDDLALYQKFNYGDDYVRQFNYGKYFGQSLRCLKDND